MKIILGGISIIAGLIIGQIWSRSISYNIDPLDELSEALILLKRGICNYTYGIKEAIVAFELNEKSTLFDAILKRMYMSSAAACTDSINESNYDQEIKVELLRLFSIIEFGNNSEIEKAFSSTVEFVNEKRCELISKREKNAPLYRKIGLLCGIGIAILII